ncbi:type II secretion system protein [Noviherbaspirillum sp. ST9]|uniref:type II secretion system protein n=1 Tax=Noviherbaspirillum sp. ST9 TaxID=3401606 RepID=UPI003B58932E
MKKTVPSMKSSGGFTMVELIIVIAILGVLAATALPRFFNVTTEARVAAVNGIAGGLRSASATAQAAYFAAGSMSATSVSMAGGTVTVAAGTGIPTSPGILQALSGGADGMQLTPKAPADTDATVEFRPNGVGATKKCVATYTASSGAVTVDTTECAN